MVEPHEWMTTFTPQSEWIENKGIFMPLAFYSGAIGSGLYLVSSYFHSLLGMFIGWLIVIILKGGFHFLDLSHPFRAFRIFARPQSSWISRGLIFVISFVVLVPLQLYVSRFFPDTTLEVILKVLAGASAFAICIYPGFTMNCINAIPMWNSAILPVLFLSSGLLGGAALALAIGMLGGDTNMPEALVGNKIFLITTIFFTVIYFWSGFYAGPVGKKSVENMTKGSLRLVFWVGMVLLGTIVPFLCLFFGHPGMSISEIIMLLGIAGEIILGLSLVYILLRIGTYSPIIDL